LINCLLAPLLAPSRHYTSFSVILEDGPRDTIQITRKWWRYQGVPWCGGGRGGGPTSHSLQVHPKLKGFRGPVGEEVDVGESEQPAVAVVVLLGQVADLLGLHRLGGEVRRRGARVLLPPLLRHRPRLLHLRDNRRSMQTFVIPSFPKTRLSAGGCQGDPPPPPGGHFWAAVPGSSMCGPIAIPGT